LKVAIVILNWNGAHFLKQFLPVLFEHTPLDNTAVYVADNGSTDDSIQLLQKEFPTVNLILFDKNYGFAGGYNKALEQISADYYMILNSDVEVSANWLKPMVDYLDHNPEVAACQPKILTYHQKNYFEHAGAAGGFIDYLGYPLCRGRILAQTEEDKGQYDDITDIFWATGACLLIRAELFHAMGGFDADFFAHMEEIDLCWRLKSRGYRIVCVPQTKVWHVGGGTLQVENPHKTYLNFRNNLLMLYKNLPAKKLQKVLLIRFFMDYLAALQLLLTGKAKNAWVVIKARLDYRKMKTKMKDRRKENLKHAVQTDIPEILQKSIIFNYYILGKKSFSELKK